MDLHDTKAALHNLTASSKSSADEDEQQMVIAKPATAQIRKAVIHKQQALNAVDITVHPLEVGRIAFKSQKPLLSAPPVKQHVKQQT